MRRFEPDSPALTSLWETMSGTDGAGERLSSGPVPYCSGFYGATAVEIILALFIGLGSQPVVLYRTVQ